MLAESELINAAKMQSFVDEIESILGKGAVIALDVFFVHNYQKVTVKSFTYALPFYRKKLLPNFLEKFGTMGMVDDNIRKFSNYAPTQESANKQIFGNSLEFEEIAPKSVKTTATFDDLLNVLKHFGFGETCYWINTFQKVQNASANLSTFLILNNSIVSSNENQLNSVVQWKLLTDFYQLIMNEFIGLNEMQLSKIDKLEETRETILKENITFKIHRELVDNYGHTIFNSLPNITTIISNVEQFIHAEFNNSELHNDIIKCRKQLELVDLTLRIIGEKDLNEIEGKSLLDMLYYIDARQISQNSIGVIDISDYSSELDVSWKRNAKEAFVILWNFWHNASKCKNYLLEVEDEKIYEFNVKLFKQENSFAISFKNIGELGDSNKTFLLSDELIIRNKNIDRKKGLEIIKERMSILGWTFIDIIVEDGYTEIIIKILPDESSIC